MVTSASTGLSRTISSSEAATSSTRLASMPSVAAWVEVRAKPSKAGKTAFIIVWEMSCTLTFNPGAVGLRERSLQETGQRKGGFARYFETKTAPKRWLTAPVRALTDPDGPILGWQVRVLQAAGQASGRECPNS